MMTSEEDGGASHRHRGFKRLPEKLGKSRRLVAWSIGEQGGGVGRGATFQNPLQGDLSFCLSPVPDQRKCPPSWPLSSVSASSETAGPVCSYSERDGEQRIKEL